MSHDLNLPTIADNQAAGQWQTSNDADAAIGNALADILTVDFSGGNVTLTSTQFRSAMTFVPSGLSTTRNLTIPGVKRALFIVDNTDATDTINVVRGSTSIAVAAGQIGVFNTDGTTNSLNGAILVTGVAVGDVSGPGSSVSGHIATFNGTTGKTIQDSGVAISTDGTFASNSDAKVATEKATKTYVDGKVAGLSWKQAVRAATTGAGTLATSFENGDTIDGVTLATGDRILVKDQATGSENGIYTVNASGAPTRATDADAGAELVNASVYVSEGTTNADTQWTCTTNAPITVGSTSLAFAQLTSGSGFSAASTTEVLTGTDTTKGVTPDALAALWEKGSDVASAGTVSLGEGGFFHITGTTTITDIDWATAKDGRPAMVVFDGALTLTHNATTLKLPGGANITTAAGDRAIFVQDSGDNVICVVYQKANGQAVVGGSSGSPWQLQWSPLVNEPPASNYATLDTRNGHPCLDFDTTTQEAAIFSGALPASYGGNGITVSVWCSLTSAITGTVGWLVSIERMDASSLDIDADSFASAQTITATTVPGTSGQLLKMSVNISNGANIDSLAAGEMFRIKIERDVTNDTATGDAELLRVMMVEQ